MGERKKINPLPGQRVKQLMKEQKITQEWLAEKLDVTPQQISYIVTGKRGLTPENAKKIAALFPPVRVEWLLGMDGYRTFADQLRDSIAQNINPSIAFESYLSCMGYIITRNTEDAPPDLSENPTKEEIDRFKVWCAAYKLREFTLKSSKDGTVRGYLSEQERDGLVNDIHDYISYKLLKLMKKK